MTWRVVPYPARPTRQRFTFAPHLRRPHISAAPRVLLGHLQSSRKHHALQVLYRAGCLAALGPLRIESAGSRRSCPRRLRPPHRVGGQTPLPPVPQRGRLPASRRRDAQRRRARRRAPAGNQQRWPRLGPRHRGAPVHRSRRTADRELRSRRHARELSLATRPRGRRRARRHAAAERALPMELRGRHRRAAADRGRL